MKMMMMKDQHQGQDHITILIKAQLLKYKKFLKDYNSLDQQWKDSTIRQIK